MTMIEDIWANAGTSTTPYADAAELEERIADDLAVLLTERFAAAKSASTALHPEPLPVPLTPLLGRDAELGEVLGLLRRPETRLVTITGPGGIGKTRLALEAAAKVALPGEVCFVDLSSVQDAALVPSVIAAALDMRLEGTRAALDVLADRLSNQPMLLVLDNFEQVSAAAREVVRLLTSAPGVRALVTSRRVLRVRGEHEVTLSPLLTPPDMDANAAAVATFPAIQVFVNRARQARPDFTITDDNAQNVADIVRRLEGIPLALELAAARIRLLSAHALLQRLDRPLDLSSHDVDAPTRQQTLRRTIAWSFDLLDGPERALMSRLAVFVGGWSLDGAEAMCRSDTAFDVLETLSFLVEHSLVTADDRPYGEPRFRMLETVRDYAVEQLRQAGEYDDAMRRLSGYVCEVVRSFADSADGDERRRASGWMPSSTASVPCCAGPWNRTMRSSCCRSLLLRTDTGGGTACCARCSTSPIARRHCPRPRGFPRDSPRCCSGRAAPSVSRSSVRRKPYPCCKLPLTTRKASTTTGCVRRVCSAWPSRCHEDAAQMRAMLEEALALFRTLDDGWSIALALTPLGDLALLEGDVPRGTAMHEEALQLAERIDDHYMRAQSLDQLALDAMLAGDVVLARSRLTAAAELHRQVRDQEGLAYCLDGLAGVALASGRTNIAAQLVGAADRIRRIEGPAVWPLMAPLSDQLRQGIAMVLGDGPYAEEHERGAAMDSLDALDLGLRND